MSPKISAVEAVSWIVGSLLITALVFHKIIQPNFLRKGLGKGSHSIEYIVQTGPSKEALRSEYLMEMLSLSKDRPCPFFLFDPLKAEQQLSKSPLIARADVKKISPNIAYIDYTLRKPIAWVADFRNAVVDKEGVVFPMHPFFSPKKLPQIVLGTEGSSKGSEEMAYGSSVAGKYTDLAFVLLDLLNKKGKDLFFVKKVDVSRAYAPTLGKREIIVMVENELYLQAEEKPVISTHFLRLTLRQYVQEIDHYLQLRQTLLESEKKEAILLKTQALKEKIIDLRLSQLAFIQ